MLPWKLRKSHILPVHQNLSSVYFSLAKFQLVSCNPSLAMIWQMTYTHKLPKLCSATLSLAVSDLGVGLTVQHSYIATLVMEMEHKTESNPADNITYKFFVFTVNLFGYASFFGVTFFSLHRFLAVYLHLRYQELVTHERVVVVIVSKWVFSAVLSFLRLWIPKRYNLRYYFSLSSLNNNDD